MSCRFTDGNGSVVAREAGADHLCVIHLACGFKRRSHMATPTGIGGSDMRSVLASCVRTVVATEAVVGNTIMAEVRRLPGCW